MMNQVTELIAPYVEKDPTAFCTYEEYEKGVETLRAFACSGGKAYPDSFQEASHPRKKGRQTTLRLLLMRRLLS